MLGGQLSRAGCASFKRPLADVNGKTKQPGKRQSFVVPLPTQPMRVTVIGRALSTSLSERLRSGKSDGTLFILPSHRMDQQKREKHDAAAQLEDLTALYRE